MSFFSARPEQSTSTEVTALTNLSALANSAAGEFLRKTGTSTFENATPSGGGTVTSVSVVTANGVSGSVASATTTPAITLTLGAITPSSVNVSGLTASELLATDASKNLQSLAAATYPSLTELSYVKGVTSAIQTQINTKAPSTAPTFATSITGSYLTASEILITDGSKNIVSAAVATYPSLTELTYVKGVTSSIQTQINAKQATLTNSAGLASALNDETGTGVAVFSTSPQLTTSLTTDSTTFALLNATATTINFAGAATALNIGASATCILNFGGSTTASEFRFLEPSGSGTNYTAFKAQAQGANITYTLPATVGAAGTFLTDAAGNGTLSWAAAGGATSIASIPMPAYASSYATSAADTWTGNTTGQTSKFRITEGVTVNQIHIGDVTTVNTAGTIKIGVFSEDGQTRYCNETTASISATGLHTHTMSSAMALNAGTYYLVIVPVSTTSIVVSGYGRAGGASVNLNNPSGEPIFTGTQTVTAGTLPTTFDPTALTTQATCYFPMIRFDN